MALHMPRIADDVLVLIWKHLIPADQPLRALQAAAPLQQVCKKWKALLQTNRLVWQDLLKLQKWDCPRQIPVINFIVDQLYCKKFIFFCRKCLSPLTVPVFLQENQHERVEFPDNPCPGHGASSKEVQSFREKWSDAFLITSSNTCCTISSPQPDEEADCVSFFSSKVFVNSSWEKRSEDSGCCGPSGCFGPNVKCESCHGIYLTAHADCIPPIQHFHMPLNRVWALPISRTSLSSLHLARQLEFFAEKHRKTIVFAKPFFGRMKAYPGASSKLQDMISLNKKRYELLSPALWNMVEPEHMEELIEDSVTRPRSKKPLKDSADVADFDADDSYELSAAEIHQRTDATGGIGSAGAGKHHHVYTSKHVRSELQKMSLSQKLPRAKSPKKKKHSDARKPHFFCSDEVLLFICCCTSLLKMQDSPYMIDRMTVYKDLGAEKITQLSRAFYTRVYNDTETWFRDIFAGRSMDDAIQNQYEFFIQRFGGPDLYSKRKGHPALKARHRDFHIDTKAADRWIMHMRASMEEVNIPEPYRAALDQFFVDVAYFLRNRPDKQS